MTGVIYNDVSGTGQWQKIDNSSVLSGVGTGQTVALWEGSGSVTDSETLGNAPITVSGNNSTFAGNVTVGALTSGETAQLIVNQEGGIAPVAKLMSRTNKAIVQISDNDTTGYVSSENGYFSLGSAAGVNAANINIATASSNVGIGVTATSDGDLTLNAPKLHVRGTDTSGAYNLVARFQGGNDADSTGAAILINHSNDRGLLIEAGRKDGDREVAYFNVISSGATVTPMLTMGKFGSAYNVGIGTTSPSSKLTVNGDARLANSGKLYLWNDHSINYLDYRTWTASSSAGMTIQNSAANGDILLLPNGNVGIGTTSPQAKLHVAGSGNESVEIKVSGGTTAGNTGSISLSRTDGSGNIIQGAAFLSGGVPISGIAGGVVGSSNTSAPAFAIQTPNSTNGHIVFNPKGTEKMRITSAGNVGIGTTSPSTKLDVAGNANISDTLAIGSLSTVPTASLGRALNIQVLANSSGTTVAQWLDIDRTITTDSTSAATWGMVLRNASTTTSTANDGKIYGAQIIGRHQGTGGIESAMGVRSTADINTTGTITTTGTLWGAYNEAQVTNGSVTFANSGIFGSASRGQVLGSGTVNITSQGVVGGALIGVLNNVNASVNRVVGGEFELDLQNGTTDKAHVVSLNTFNIVSPTNLSIDEFAYIYLGEDVAIPTTITDNAYFIKSLTSLPSELAGSIEATSFIKTGGTSSQFLKADGSIDSTSYAPATGGSYLPLAGGTMTGNFNNHQE